MIKASAGGGGKGMRVAWNDKEVEEGFYASKNEASNSFGDDRLFIEKYIVDPRHIEIQILGDCHNNLLHLGERECSIQRRNQKVIEEAPSTFIDEETRNKMGEQACKLAKAVGYTSAGTVEFIVDKDKNFYFLEMNTRLQVEHPVTELITGVDLVEEMIKIAQGKRLSFVQDDIKLNGWAIESRLYAEDPYRNFLPSIGRLTRYRPPNELTLSELVIRNDTGVTEGGEISIFYDPMIAKLCTWANSRPEAIKLMRDALDDFEIEGVGHNLPFLSAVMGHARFISGDITTAFIENEYQGGFVGVTLEEDELRLVSSAIVSIHIFNEVRKSNISGRVNDILEVVGGDWQVSVQGVESPVKVVKNKNEVLVQYADLETQRVNFKWLPGDILVKFIINGENYSLKVNNIIGGYRVRFRGADLKVQVKTSRQVQMSLLMLEKKDMDTSKSLLCPMPGLVTSIDVMEGDEFEQGQTLCTIEAMKMENTLKAEKRGVVKTILAQVNQSISVDQLIMEFE
jgi:propionyl-CoA carboxylase alpha chain